MKQQSVKTLTRLLAEADRASQHNARQAFEAHTEAEALKKKIGELERMLEEQATALHKARRENIVIRVLVAAAHNHEG